ncbi:MAG: DUF5666 domain-containing protein [Candidatus Staskawiczbacteria bacterium]|nr:DUF5666 domain-containing protein [Candidatus Staskawiczbacteria bacterium]
MNKKTLLIIKIVVLLVVAGGAFYGGILYSKLSVVYNGNQKSSAFAGGNFQGARGNRTGNGGNFISGSIIAKDATSITLQLPGNAGSKIIFYSATTQISKMATGTADDLATGTAVSVNGATNSDGSVTAQSIQIRPINGIKN